MEKMESTSTSHITHTAIDAVHTADSMQPGTMPPVITGKNEPLPDNSVAVSEDEEITESQKGMLLNGLSDFMI